MIDLKSNRLEACRDAGKIEAFSPSFQSYPRLWIRFFSFLTIVITGGLTYFMITEPTNYNLLTVLGLLLITFLTVAVLLQKKDQQFIYILFWGMYVALIVFFSSNYWLWELNEAYAVKPIAKVVQKYVPPQESVYIDFDYHRPSLDFYSDKKIIPSDRNKLRELLKSPSYLLVNQHTLSDLDFIFENSLYCFPQLETQKIINDEQPPKMNCWKTIPIDESEFTLLKPISNQ